DELKIDKDVKFLGYLTQEDLRTVFSSATIFAFPSLYEGFGIPILEAMACGTPVITSNVSSMPEVAGDAAKLVNPFDIEDIKEAIQFLLENEDVREAMTKKGLKRAAEFSWDRCARETLEVYHKTVDS
ncbi:MAG: glycosyltransferase family 4 protein, partial [Proteobacteria bacterium]|nr:glycosyltransferase family 4 protein [Pseudomonadota bacterium]